MFSWLRFFLREFVQAEVNSVALSRSPPLHRIGAVIFNNGALPYILSPGALNFIRGPLKGLSVPKTPCSLSEGIFFWMCYVL